MRPSSPNALSRQSTNSRCQAGFTDFDTVRISLATAEDILNWSHGEVSEGRDD